MEASNAGESGDSQAGLEMGCTCGASANDGGPINVTPQLTADQRDALLSGRYFCALAWACPTPVSHVQALCTVDSQRSLEGMN